MGSDVDSDGLVTFSDLVSIHAPAWGATLIILVRVDPSSFVSIHAPAWGATVKLNG